MTTLGTHSFKKYKKMLHLRGRRCQIMVGHAWLWCQSERMGSLVFLLNVSTRIDKPEMVIEAIKSEFMNVVA